VNTAIAANGMGDANGRSGRKSPISAANGGEPDAPKGASAAPPGHGRRVTSAKNFGDRAALAAAVTWCSRGPDPASRGRGAGPVPALLVASRGGEAA
jgi:hypothetical protein